MRNALAIVLYIAAGFFAYMVCLLAFVNDPKVPKWTVVAGFSLPFLAFLCAGLAVKRFHRWKRDVGVVLLSGAGFAVFVALMFVCMLQTDEFRKMLKTDSLQFFSAYTSGSIFILSMLALGVIFLKAGQPRSTLPPIPTIAS